MTYILTPSQKIIVQDNHRYRVVRAGRRMGKTILAELEIAGKAFAKSGRNIFYIATTYQQARDIAWQGLKKILEPIISSINESRLEIIVKTQDQGYSSIQLRGWESIETLRGQKADFIVIDEIASMKNFWINWEEVIRPTLTDTRGEVLFISTPKGFNHFYELCNEELKDKDFKTFHFTSYDNPHMPVDEIDSAKQSLSPESFAQEYMASFQKTEGLVYKEFDRNIHLYEKLPQKLPRVAGVDFGFQNPAAILDIRTDGDRFYVEAEWYQVGKTDIQIAEYVSACNFPEVYADPESPQAIEELRRKRVNVREVIKGQDSVEAGIKKVKELLITKRLMVNKECVNLISEFEMYAYDVDDGMKNAKEKPIKANDHALDALRYVVMMKQPIQPVQQFRRGVGLLKENSSK